MKRLRLFIVRVSQNTVSISSLSLFGLQQILFLPESTEGVAVGAVTALGCQPEGETQQEKAQVSDGMGYSVLEIIAAFEDATGINIPYEFAPRRPGVVAACWSSPEKAWKELGWSAEMSLKDMCRDSWNWQKKNPHGY